VRIVDRGAKVVVVGNDAETAVVGKMLDEMLVAVRKGHTPSVSDVTYALNEARNRELDHLGDVLGEVPSALRREFQIKPRTRGQRRYLDTITSHDLTLAIGPAGTGKTYLAMAAAISALLNNVVSRVVLTRPAVEAGENLGFLPGDLQQKVNPYLRPLYDALYSMLDYERARRLIERETIEVAPLAFMRGRTLSNAFVILDEAQNTKHEQMKMFLTRLGENSKAVITGDITQIDLPKGVTSGLVEARNILKGIANIGIVHLTRGDVVRHALVQDIIAAYEHAESRGGEDDRASRSGEETPHAKGFRS